MVEKFFFLSGLPRAGSTLLSALIGQNPDFHAEGNSALCQMMWDAQQSCRTTAFEQLAANARFDKMQSMLCSTLPYMYYDGIETKYVLDKCRSWTLPDNMQLLHDYFDAPTKVVVLVRPIEDVVRSFMQVHVDNGRDIEPETLLTEWADPIMRSYNGAMHAKICGVDNFLFVDYDNLVTNPTKQLERIYSFFGVPTFNHSFVGVENKHPEQDSVYGLLGLHDIRPEVKKRQVDYVLSADIEAMCIDLTDRLYDGLDVGE